MKKENQDHSPEEAPSFHDQLLKALVARGMVDADILKEDPSTRKKLVRIGAEKQATAETYRDTRHDGQSGTPVNCEERLHLCKAVCCKLGFALSEAEVEQGIVNWEPEKPFFKRHDADGYCSHLKRDGCSCTIYSDRPKPCHTYSCTHDPRIWTNFAKMELNKEWIEGALMSGDVEERGARGQTKPNCR